MVTTTLKHTNKNIKDHNINLNKKDILNNINQLVYETAEKLGLIVLEVSLNKEKGSHYLRIYIYNPNGTVSHSECTDMTRLLSNHLDELNFIDFPYSLEVSSPGINRKIKNPIEFDVFKGKLVKVILKNQPSEKGVINTHIGELLGLTSDHKSVIIKINDSETIFSLNDIKTIQLEG